MRHSESGVLIVLVACPGSEYPLHEGPPCLLSLEYIFYKPGPGGLAYATSAQVQPAQVQPAVVGCGRSQCAGCYWWHTRSKYATKKAAYPSSENLQRTAQFGQGKLVELTIDWFAQYLPADSIFVLLPQFTSGHQKWPHLN